MGAAAKVIVMSTDYLFVQKTMEALSENKKYDFERCFCNTATAKTALDSRKNNILIVDLETQRVTDVYLAVLTSGLNAMVIILGTSNVQAFINQGITDFMSKPAKDNSFAFNIFIRGLRHKIDAFLYESTGGAAPSVAGNSESLLVKKDNRPGYPVAGLQGRGTKPIVMPETAPKMRPGEAMAGNLAGEPKKVAYSQFYPEFPVSRNDKILLIAASTGGTDAIPQVIKDLPEDCCPVVIVQHMPNMFTKQFAERLDRISKIAVKEAATGDFLQKGLALVAPGDLHIRLVERRKKLAVECFEAEKLHGVRPAADILLKSAAEIMDCVNVYGAILTGMGGDGAEGFLQLRSKGAFLVGQDEETSTIYGMPKVAMEKGGVDIQLPLGRIGKTLAEAIMEN